MEFIKLLVSNLCDRVILYGLPGRDTPAAARRTSSDPNGPFEYETSWKRPFQTIRYRFTADLSSPKSITGVVTATVPLAAPGIRATWTFRLSYVGPAGDLPRLGDGKITATLDSSWRVSGLYKIQRIRYEVAVWGFGVNESDLLPRHYQVLNKALDILANAAGETSDAITRRVPKGPGTEEITLWWEGKEYPDGKPSPSTNAIPPVPGSIRFSMIVGRASQTGPEANNLTLSTDRAQAVGSYLLDRPGVPALLHVGGLGDMVPVIDAPSEEISCNRFAAFEFTVDYRVQEVYTRHDAVEWLRKELRHASNEDQRRTAKVRFLIRMNWIDMVKAGYTNPPGEEKIVSEHDPRSMGESSWYVDVGAYKALIEEFAGKGGGPGVAATQTATGYKFVDKFKPFVKSPELSGSEPARRRWHYRAATDPYFKYTMDGASPEAEAEYKSQADAIERGIFGDVVDWDDF